MEKYKSRTPTRFQRFDYNTAGGYFVTVCTEKRLPLLSRITVGADVLDGPQKADVLDGPQKADVLDGPHTELLEYGKIAEKYIRQLNDFYEDITVDQYVIMPDHIHLLIVIHSGPSRTSAPTETRQHARISQIVSTFKRFCNKEYGYNIWQRSFYDHVIRNREDYEEIAKYIYENPMRWYYKRLIEKP